MSETSIVDMINGEQIRILSNENHDLRFQLAQGRKAIEVMEKIIKWWNNDLVFAGSLKTTITCYQQSCKEDVMNCQYCGNIVNVGPSGWWWCPNCRMGRW